MTPRIRSLLGRPSAARDGFVGAAALLLLINLTLFPFVWGHSSLRDSIVSASIYRTGSRPPAAIHDFVAREVDPGAPAWQTEPWFVLEHDILARERVAPLWNPYSSFGTPLAANMQSQPYSPFAWIAVASKDPRAYNFFVAARLYAAGVLALLYLRLFVGFWPSLLGGAAFMYTGYFWEFVTMPEISVEACLPGLLLATELLLRRQSLSRVALFACMLAVAIFGGMPESLILALAMVYAYGFVRVLGDAGLRAGARRSLSAIAAGSVCGAGLGAVQIVPFLEYLPLSRNDHAAAMDWGITSDPLSRATAALYLAPLFQGPPWNDIFSGNAGFTELRGSFGCATVFLALVAVLDRARQALRRGAALPTAFFSSVSVFCLLKRFGSPAVEWVGRLPLLKLVNFPKYEEMLLGCAVSVLAAFGLAAILERRVSGVACAAAAAVPLLVLTAAAGARKSAFAALAAAPRTYFDDALLCALASLLLVFGLALLSRANRFGRGVVGLAVVLLVAGEANASYIVPMFYTTQRDPSQSADTLRGAQFVSYLQSHASDGSRFFGRDELLFPNWSAAFGVRDVRGLDALYDRRYLRFVNAFLETGDNDELTDRFFGTGPVDFRSPATQRFLQLASIRYIGTEAPLDLAGPMSLAFQNQQLTASATLGAGRYSLAGERRSGLFLAPGSAGVTVPVDVPRNATALRFAVGLLPPPETRTACPLGVRFSLDVRDGARTERIWERSVDPVRVPGDRRWLGQNVPIARYRGRPIEAVLNASPRPSGSSCDESAVWSELRFDGAAPPPGRVPAYRTVYVADNASISEFARPLPRVALYGRVVVARNEGAALALLRSRDFDPTSEAIVESDGTDTALAALANEPRRRVAAARLFVDRSRVVEATIDTPRAGLVVLSDTYFPGWKAFVDGRPTPIVRANYLFRGVTVGPGRHVLTFRYEPASYALGRDVSLGSLFAVTLVLGAGRFRGRTRS